MRWNRAEDITGALIIAVMMNRAKVVNLPNFEESERSAESAPECFFMMELENFWNIDPSLRGHEFEALRLGITFYEASTLLAGYSYNFCTMSGIINAVAIMFLSAQRGVIRFESWGTINVLNRNLIDIRQSVFTLSIVVIIVKMMTQFK